MANYSLLLRDPAGNKLGDITNFVTLDYACKENEYGTMILTLPRCDEEKFFAKDMRIEIWRTVGAKTYLEANTVWFMRKARLVTDARGVKTWELTAYDANYLLAAREVEYNAGTSQTKKTAAIDDMMKAIFAENLGSSAGAGRDWSAYITCQANMTLAPSTTKAFARRNVMEVLQELAQESYQRGTYLVFAIQYVNPTTLEFRTFVNQLGINHGRTSGQTITVNEARSSLVLPVLEGDYTNEITVVTAGGMGQEADRTTSTVTDTTRAGETIFSRRESFINATGAKLDTTALEAEARAELQKNRPIRTLTGSIQDTDALAYGFDYNFGDIVVAEYENVSFDAHVDRIHITKGKNGENIDNQIRGVL